MRTLLLLLGLSALSSFGAVPGDDWRYSDILSLLQQRGEAIRTPDDLIREFPEGMKRHFTFVFETGSKLQNADPLRPRALVFNQNMIYAFNGAPDQKGYSSIEVMELDEKGKKLNLREIEFRDGRAVAGTETPAKCLGCHGTSPRPIWQEYSTWKGVYGSSDDRMETDESKNYRDFLARVRRNEPDQARYALLKFPAGSEMTPYPDDKTQSAFGFRINLVLTKLLTRFNVIHLVGLAERSPKYEQIVPPMLYLQYCRGENEVRERFTTRLGGKPEWAVLGISPFVFSMTASPRYDNFFDGSGSQNENLQWALTLGLVQRHPELAESLRTDREYHRERYGAYEMYRRIDTLVPHVVGAPDCEGMRKLAERSGI